MLLLILSDLPAGWGLRRARAPAGRPDTLRFRLWRPPACPCARVHAHERPPGLLPAPLTSVARLSLFLPPQGDGYCAEQALQMAAMYYGGWNRVWVGEGPSVCQPGRGAAHPGLYRPGSVRSWGLPSQPCAAHRPRPRPAGLPRVGPRMRPPARPPTDAPAARPPARLPPRPPAGIWIPQQWARTTAGASVIPGKNMEQLMARCRVDFENFSGQGEGFQDFVQFAKVRARRAGRGARGCAGPEPGRGGRGRARLRLRPPLPAPAPPRDAPPAAQLAAPSSLAHPTPPTLGAGLGQGRLPGAVCGLHRGREGQGLRPRWVVVCLVAQILGMLGRRTAGAPGCRRRPPRPASHPPVPSC